MQESLFRRWLESIYDDNPTCTSRLSNCRRIEQYEGDLDAHFRRDKMASLLARLQYSTADAERRAEPQHRIPIKGNLRTGTATLRNAARLYLQFREGLTAEPDRRERRDRRPRSGSPGKWPEWETPSAAEILALARVVTQYVRFLAPSVVEALVTDTERHRERWAHALEAKGIDSSLYLWPRTSCAFPGIRRHAGSAEIARFRGQQAVTMIENAVALDDNTYPKHIWSFLLRGRPFQNFGPAGYALAHLADHKAYKNRSAVEIVGSETNRTYFGLYTSASNTVFVPTGLIRPTDFVPELRGLLQRKAADLYGSFCQLLPPGTAFAPCPAPEWEIDRYEWAPAVGYSHSIDQFLEFRRAQVERLLLTE